MSRLTLVSWNVNGLRAAHAKGFLGWFLGARPDVLCLQETRAHEDQLPRELREVEGYRAWFSAPRRRGYSGVAIYSRPESVAVRGGMGIPRFDEEGRMLSADYGDFLLFNVYFPNGKQSRERLAYKLDFYEAFLEHVEALRAKGRGIVIGGDFNTAHKEIDLARPKENSKVSGFLPEERAWMDRLVERGYLDTFRLFNSEPGHYTWWDQKTGARERNVGWRIDYFFVSSDLEGSVKEAFILPDVEGSDHCPVGLVLEL
ncbi:exodeoxyribonuclease III [Candidatus Solincola sp.]|nr:exodeoxyribonuclease III [Actinomycetota bacterium]MDI7252835.1 exodeoxyribonuclease III [Actinomycetota bacterium]